MKVRELTGTRMIEVPDEWVARVEKLKEIIPTINDEHPDINVYITLHGNGNYDITIHNGLDAKPGEKWINYCDYVANDGGGYKYVSEYVKGEDK